MGASKKTQLFRFVAALSAPEKAYFKKYVYKATAVNSATLDLFNLIDKQLKKGAEVDEERLQNDWLKKQPSGDYVKVKSRLLQQLLDTLRDYDRRHNSESKIFDLLEYAQSLSERELFEDAIKMLAKAEKLADELELLGLGLMIRQKRYSFEISAQTYTAKNEQSAVLKEMEQQLNVLQEGLAADQFIYNILHYQKTIGTPRNQQEQAQLQQLLAHPSFKASYQPPLSNTRLDIAIARSGLCFSSGQAAAALEHCVAALEDHPENPKLANKYLAKYLSVYDCLLQAALLSFQFAVYEKYLPQFYELKATAVRDKQLKAAIGLYAEAMHSIVAQQIGRFEALIPRFHQVREGDFVPTYRKVSLAYYMITGAFLAETFEQAYDLIQWLRNNQHLGIRLDIEVPIRIMECLVLLEQEQYDLLAYQLRAFYEFSRSRQRIAASEKIILKMLQQSLRCANEKERQELYKSKQAELIACSSADMVEHHFLSTCGALSWLEYKVSGTPLNLCYAQRYLPATS